MRIRNYRQEDLPTLIHIQEQAALADSGESFSENDFVAWLANPELDVYSNLLVITDDDDELNTWGQAGTLEGIEGEIVGYTVVRVQQDQQGYHLLCQGTVEPQFRHQKAGRALLICALNRAQILAAEFEFEAEAAGLPVYFEAFLPERDPASPRLAARCEMLPTDERTDDGKRLYRREL